MANISDFVQQHHVTMTAERIGQRTDGSATEWGPGSTHWKLRLRRQGSAGGMTVEYSMGSAHKDEPVITDVLDCLASDVSGYVNAGSFESWAEEYGFDADSRHAERMYKIISGQHARLIRLLGEAAFNELLWETDRE